jgi:hypothetical protein
LQHESAYHIALFPDEKRIVSSSGMTLNVLDLRTGQTVCRYTADAEINCLAVAADGEVVVVGDLRGGMHFLQLVETAAG